MYVLLAAGISVETIADIVIAIETIETICVFLFCFVFVLFCLFVCSHSHAWNL